jgi:hypothetical protein
MIQHKLVSMGTASNRASSALRFWRRLVGAAAIYALVMQPLLLAVAGSQQAQASAFDDIALSQLCLHQTDRSPAAPVDQPKHPAHSHCLLCFAGAFLLDAPNPTKVSAVISEVRKVRPTTAPLRLASSSQYLVARPRGPPFST